MTRRFAYRNRRIDPARVDLVHSMISANAVDALTDFVDTLGTHDRIAALPGLRQCEVLVAAGDADELIPFAHSQVIAGALPDATLVRLPGVGHLLMLERARGDRRGADRPAGRLRRAAVHPEECMTRSAA